MNTECKQRARRTSHRHQDPKVHALTLGYQTCGRAPRDVTGNPLTGYVEQAWLPDRLATEDRKAARKKRGLEEIEEELLEAGREA